MCIRDSLAHDPRHILAQVDHGRRFEIAVGPVDDQVDLPLEQLPGDEHPLNDPYEMRQLLERQVDLIIDGAYGDLEPTTVVDLSEDVPRVVREGRGDVARLGTI
jgi:hypothetical protein